MRVHIYEDNEHLIDKLCKKFGVSPTKLINQLVLELEDELCRNKRAKKENEVFTKFNRD